MIATQDICLEMNPQKKKIIFPLSSRRLDENLL